MSTTDSRRIANVRDRLVAFFGVEESSIITAGRGAMYAFFVPGLYVSKFTPEVHVDANSFTASASPIMAHEVTSGDGSKALKRFARRALVEAQAGVNPSSPMAIFHMDFNEQTAWALNDSFGIGRLFSAHHEGVLGLSNNIAALALLGDELVEADTSFWDSYYTSGGAVGEGTYIKGVRRALGGTTMHVTQGTLRSASTHSIEHLLLESFERESDYMSPARAGIELIDAAKPFFNERLSIGLSGGRDSRFVTSMALAADLVFQSFTAVPPDLEAEIAAKLHAASRIPFAWEARDRRKPVDNSPASVATSAPPTIPIIDRARDWFRFSGGDCWPTFMRRPSRPRKPVNLASMAVSGAFGDFARGHYYSEKDLQDPSGKSAVSRFHRAFTATRNILPIDVRERGAANIKDTFEEMADRGFTGFRALDLSFIINRQRRQLPHPAPNTLIPMLTAEMAAETFWDEPSSRVNAAGLRRMTLALMPEWDGIPYFHEAVVGTDPMVTNKVSIQPTYWEVDENDFFLAVEHATEVNNFIDLPMDRVRSEIADLPEGRNRTNVTFEYMFWHAGATKLLFDINRVLLSM